MDSSRTSRACPSRSVDELRSHRRHYRDPPHVRHCAADSCCRADTESEARAVHVARGVSSELGSYVDTSKARLGDAGRDLGISSIRSVSSSDDIVNQTDDVADIDGSARVRGWKDGLRIAGAGVDEEAEMDSGAIATLPRSGSSNGSW